MAAFGTGGLFALMGLGGAMGLGEDGSYGLATVGFIVGFIVGAVVALQIAKGNEPARPRVPVQRGGLDAERRDAAGRAAGRAPDVPQRGVRPAVAGAQSLSRSRASVRA
jgi:Na+/glutamate symporter